MKKKNPGILGYVFKTNNQLSSSFPVLHPSSVNSFGYHVNATDMTDLDRKNLEDLLCNLLQSKNEMLKNNIIASKILFQGDILSQ